MEDLACSVASLQANESLVGTAVDSVDRWLLLEVTDTWAPKAIQTEALSDVVRARLNAWLEAPRTRLQLIRRPGRSGRTPMFMFASPTGVTGTELSNLEDLADIELESLPALSSPPLCLVCVHGRRDRCCARHGSAVYRTLQGTGFDLWQTSHLGGHRFAACVLTLPDGLMYGRLRAEHAEPFAMARQADDLWDLDYLRGRTAYDRPTQAAEIFIRRRTGLTASGSFEWLDTTPTGDQIWTVRFNSPTGEQTIGVRRETTNTLRPASCGGDPEPINGFVEVG